MLLDECSYCLNHAKKLQKETSLKTTADDSILKDLSLEQERWLPLKYLPLPYNCTIIFVKLLIARLMPKRYRSCLPYNCTLKNPLF